MPGQRKERPCPTCRESLKKGYLWLGGKDYLACPTCGGSGTFVMYEEKVTPPKSFAVNGLKPERQAIVDGLNIESHSERSAQPIPSTTFVGEFRVSNPGSLVA
jgi:hypothetical protein